jgi:hypothetical protein
VAEEIKCLTSKSEVLSSNPISDQKMKGRRRRRRRREEEEEERDFIYHFKFQNIVSNPSLISRILENSETIQKDKKIK